MTPWGPAHAYSAHMRTPLWLVVPIVVLALAGCAGAEPAAAPTVTETVTETVEAEAPMPEECADAFEAAEALLQQSSELSDDWQRYATGPMLDLLQGATTETEDAVIVEHQAMVDAQTAFADALTTSEYADLKVACLSASS